MDYYESDDDISVDDEVMTSGRDEPPKKKMTRRVRRITSKWTREEENNLAMAVEMEEVLWNVANRNYRDRDSTCAAWARVAVIVQHTTDECTHKWGCLRSNCRVTQTHKHIFLLTFIYLLYSNIYFQARIAAAKKTKRGRAPKKLSEPYSLMTFLESVFDMEPVRSVSSMVSLIVAVVVVSSGNRHILPFDLASDHKVNQKFLSDLLRSIRYASVIVLYS